LLTQVVAKCQSAGVLRLGPADLMSVSVWGAIHGFVTLILEGQVSHTILERHAWQEMLIFTLSQMTLMPISADILSE